MVMVVVAAAAVAAGDSLAWLLKAGAPTPRQLRDLADSSTTILGAEVEAVVVVVVVAVAAVATVVMAAAAAALLVSQMVVRRTRSCWSMSAGGFRQ